MKRIRLIILLLIGVYMCIFLLGCDRNYNIPDYPETMNKFEYSTDSNIASRFDESLLNNSDRGFRGETYLTLGSEVAYPSSKITAYEELDNALNRYEEEGVKIMQLYVYLIEYHNKPLDDIAIQQLTDYFNYLRDRGVRVLLRFAYEYTSSMKVGPKTKQIVEHCDTLSGWFSDNNELTKDVIYAMQFGMIGLWGEGHGGVHRHSIPKIARALADMAADYTIMVRTPKILSKIPDDIKHRFSIHDDFLVGIDHPWGMLPFDHKDYDKLMRFSKFHLTDGEMPWGRDTTVPEIDHILFLRQCVNYGLTTLSIEHNYKEEGNEYHLIRWQSVYLTEQELIDNNFPYAPMLLEDGKISVYKYLDYHLGYLLFLSNLTVSENRAELMITNYGFSAPYDYSIEIKTEEGIICYDFDMSNLRQFGQYKLSINTEGDYVAIRFKHNRADNQYIKLANDIPYIEGFNYIYYN